VTDKLRVCSGCKEIVGVDEECFDCRPVTIHLSLDDAKSINEVSCLACHHDGANITFTPTYFVYELECSNPDCHEPFLKFDSIDLVAA